jgi:hypothetical protein
MSNTTKTAKTYTTCSRCDGSGIWAGNWKACFKCGGSGKCLVYTQAVKVELKKAHIAEVEGIIATTEAALLTARFGKSQVASRLEAAKANLANLVAELAALEA